MLRRATFLLLPEQPGARTDVSIRAARFNNTAGLKALRESSFEAGSIRLAERVEDLGDCLKWS